MSKENRPNLNAVGLIVDIMESLEQHVRGPAQAAGFHQRVWPLLEDDVKKFIEQVDESLNQYFGTSSNNPNRLMK